MHEWGKKEKYLTQMLLNEIINSKFIISLFLHTYFAIFARPIFSSLICTVIVAFLFG